jgi:hypothetical protein
MSDRGKEIVFILCVDPKLFPQGTVTSNNSGLNVTEKRDGPK